MPGGNRRYDAVMPIVLLPFREYVIKVHSRCNLACDYCYMYELADKSARTDPAKMNPMVFERVRQRIAEHVRENRVPSARIVLHGGEPTLVGIARLTDMAKALRASMPGPTATEISVQTNGLRIDSAAIDALASADVKIGVSLDGDRRASDRHRRFRSGRSSFMTVDRALRALRSRPDTFAGILCVVDVANDPVATFEALLAYAPPQNTRLPATACQLDTPRAGAPTGDTAYGRWLIAVFDRWYSAPRQETRVRIFEEIINLLLGGRSRTESVGLSPIATIVINVDGSYEQIDTLRSAHPGAVATGLNAFRSCPLMHAMRHPAVMVRQIGLAGLSEQML